MEENYNEDSYETRKRGREEHDLVAYPKRVNFGMTCYIPRFIKLNICNTPLSLYKCTYLQDSQSATPQPGPPQPTIVHTTLELAYV